MSLGHLITAIPLAITLIGLPFAWAHLKLAGIALWPIGKIGVFPYWGPYAVSKAGLEMLVKIYAGEISKTRVRSNLIDPGIVRTRLRARASPGEDPSRLPPPESVAEAFLALALPESTRNREVVMPPPFRCGRINERRRSSLTRQSRPLHPLPETPFFCRCSGRDLPAVGVLRLMAEPILDIGDEPPGGG